MRGDRPTMKAPPSVNQKFTPHARGSTQRNLYNVKGENVYPACAGIDLYSMVSEISFFGLPRMRGDRPYSVEVLACPVVFTPHARGSTLCYMTLYSCGKVYPACAGIDPSPKGPAPGQTCLPRMRGDRPPLLRLLSLQSRFTPHARGSTCGSANVGPRETVYPACAGIDLL